MKTPAGAVERRLRIALLVDRFGNRFGGADAYGVELMRVLGQRRDVSVVARDFDSDLPFPFLPVRFPAWLPSWMRVLYFAWRADRLTRGRYDIVHSHMNGWAGEIQVMHVTPVRYNRLTRVKPLQRLTATARPAPGHLPAAGKLRVRADAGAARGGRRGSSWTSCIAATVLVPVDIIAPGVKLPTAAQREGREETRARLGWDAETIGCLLVARNPLRKGLPALLDALGQLPPQYRLPAGRGGRADPRTRAGRGRHRQPRHR